LEVLASPTGAISSSDSSVAVAVILFIIGSAIQAICHVTLANLRPNKAGPTYAIPEGKFFDYVSCPHYFGEIIIYMSFVILTRGQSKLAWLIFCFVVENLTYSAMKTHSWYMMKFKEYPPSRKALIPFIL